MSLARKVQGASAILVVRQNDEKWNPFPTELIDEASANTNVVLVSGSPNLAAWLGSWQQYHDEPSNRLCSVVTDGTFRGGESRPTRTQSRLTMEVVDRPTNLSDLGRLVDEYLRSWSTDTTKTVLVHSSLTRVLQYVELRELFQFVVVLRKCLRNSGSLGVFYIDGDAHDEQTIGTLRVAFDAVVSRDDDSLSVKYS